MGNMSSPTFKELTKAFPKVDSGKLEELADVMSNLDNVADDDNKFVKAVDEAMDKANEVLDGHGVEAIAGEGSDLGKYWRDTILLYVNLGDTYDTTICFDPDEEEFFIGSCGAFFEEWEKEDEREEGEE